MAHDKDTKAAVMAALLAGQSIDQAAEEHQIPRSTVGRWRKKAYSLLEDVEMDGDSAEAIGDLLETYVRTAIRAIIAQAEVMAEADWVRSQDASEAAVLHGVNVDKIVRLLTAMEGAPVQDSSPSTNGRNRVKRHA